MGNVFTLDAMREDIEREFAPLQIEVDGKLLTLKNLLRVPKKNRDEVYRILDEMNKNNEDSSTLSQTEAQAALALQIFPLVADDRKLGEKLVAAIEDDLALTLRMFSTWMEQTQAGESDGSPDS